MSAPRPSLLPLHQRNHPFAIGGPRVRIRLSPQAIVQGFRQFLGNPPTPFCIPNCLRFLYPSKPPRPLLPFSRALRAVFLSASIQAESGSVCYFERVYDRENPKRIYYLSMEFLIGRSLSNNVANLLLDPFVQRAAQQRHLDCGGGREPTPTSFGSFSAIPSSAWRRSISAQTSDAVIPISLHSTTRL